MLTGILILLRIGDDIIRHRDQLIDLLDRQIQNVDHISHTAAPFTAR